MKNSTKVIEKNIERLEAELTVKKEELKALLPETKEVDKLRMTVGWENSDGDHRLVPFICSLTRWKTEPTVNPLDWRLMLLVEFDGVLIPGAPQEEFPTELPKMHITAYDLMTDALYKELVRKCYDPEEQKREKNKGEELLAKLDKMVLMYQDYKGLGWQRLNDPNHTPLLSAQLPDELKEAIREKVRESIRYDINRRKALPKNGKEGTKENDSPERKGYVHDPEAGAMLFFRIKEDFKPEDLEIIFEDGVGAEEYHRKRGVNVKRIHELESEADEIGEFIKSIQELQQQAGCA
jgi:hypothetical protein